MMTDPSAEPGCRGWRGNGAYGTVLGIRDRWIPEAGAQPALPDWGVPGPTKRPSCAKSDGLGETRRLTE